MQGLNAAPFWEKVDFREYIPMVPTSAITGDGMGDLIALLVTFSLKLLTRQLMLSMELEALVLEVRLIGQLVGVMSSTSGMHVLMFRSKSSLALEPPLMSYYVMVS